jgi:hypothetical protein
LATSMVEGQERYPEMQKDAHWHRMHWSRCSPLVSRLDDMYKYIRCCEACFPHFSLEVARLGLEYRRIFLDFRRDKRRARNRACAIRRSPSS